MLFVLSKFGCAHLLFRCRCISCVIHFLQRTERFIVMACKNSNPQFIETTSNLVKEVRTEIVLFVKFVK